MLAAVVRLAGLAQPILSGVRQMYYLPPNYSLKRTAAGRLRYYRT